MIIPIVTKEQLPIDKHIPDQRFAKFLGDINTFRPDTDASRVRSRLSDEQKIMLLQNEAKKATIL